MDFNQVRYFLALANTLNFTRAAEHCYVSQPALTQAIKRLEDELGGKLIHRDGRYTELTELGKSLREHFEQIDRTRHLVRTTAKAVISGEVAELNIGLMCTIGPRVLAGMLDTFQMQHPMVSLVLHAELDAVPLRAVAKQRYIDRLHCEFRKEFLEFCEDEDFELDVAFRSQREDWIQSLIRDGVGVSVIPQYSLLRPELDFRPITDPVLSRQVEFAVVDQSEVTATLAMLIEQAKTYDWQVGL